jgi:hypothetical protein
MLQVTTGAALYGTSIKHRPGHYGIKVQFFNIFQKWELPMGVSITDVTTISI